MPSKKRWREELFEILPTRAKVRFFSGVFFLFATPAVLYDLASRTPSSPGQVAFWAIWSGAVGVGWALGFLRSLRILAIVIPLSILMPMVGSSGFWGRPLSLHSALLMASSIALIVAGYVFFIIFISHEGVTSLRLRTEMNLAREIHAGLVPPLNFKTDTLEVRGISSPATEVGGDLLDYGSHGGQTGFYVADVSGHGVPAGVLMAMIKSALRMKSVENPDLGSLSTELNTFIYESTSPSIFATFAALRFDGRGNAAYTLAGHLPIHHWGAADGRLTRLENQHPPLGLLPGHVFTASTTPVAPGDLFVIFTDGLTEVRRADGEEFDEERLEEILGRTQSQPLEAIETAVMEAVQSFGAQLDDQTLLLVKVRPGA